MYLLFRYHHILPSRTYRLPAGEKKILRAFMQYEMKARAQEREARYGESD